jgi:hypothetical protein
MTKKIVIYHIVTDINIGIINNICCNDNTENENDNYVVGKNDNYVVGKINKNFVSDTTQKKIPVLFDRDDSISIANKMLSRLINNENKIKTIFGLFIIEFTIELNNKETNDNEINDIENIKYKEGGERNYDEVLNSNKTIVAYKIKTRDGKDTVRGIFNYGDKSKFKVTDIKFRFHDTYKTLIDNKFIDKNINMHDETGILLLKKYNLSIDDINFILAVKNKNINVIRKKTDILKGLHNNETIINGNTVSLLEEIPESKNDNNNDTSFNFIGGDALFNKIAILSKLRYLEAKRLKNLENQNGGVVNDNEYEKAARIEKEYYLETKRLSELGFVL